MSYSPSSSSNSLTIHVILTFLFVKLTLLLGSCILILLVLRDQIVHVGFGLCELHLVHSFTCVPVEECLATEHGREELSHTLEHLLNGGGIPQECHCHLQALWWDIADSSLNVVWNPFHEVRAVLVLDVEHLLIHFLCRHAPAEQRSCCQVATVTRICSTHHVLGIKHLLGQLGHREGTILLRTTRCKRRETHHEEVQAREWNKIYCKLAEICVQLAREPQ